MFARDNVRSRAFVAAARFSPATAPVPRGDGPGRRAGRHGAGFARAATLVALLLLAAPATSQQIGAWQLARGAFGDVHWGAPVATQTGLLLLTGGAGECHAAIDTGARCCWSTNVADWVCGSSSIAASSVPITDAGGYFTAVDVEAALQEIGAGTTLDGRYVRRDGSDGLIPGTDSVTLQPQTQPGASPTNFVRVDQDGVSASAGDGGDHGAGFTLGTDGTVSIASSADSVRITAFLHTLLLANTGLLTLDAVPVRRRPRPTRATRRSLIPTRRATSQATRCRRSALLTAADRLLSAPRRASVRGYEGRRPLRQRCGRRGRQGHDTRLNDSRTPTAHARRTRRLAPIP
jgi:hypothetical protein